MKLFGYPVKTGDMVYSVSMGTGTVETVMINGIYVNHSGQRWRYNNNLVRSGCKLSDLSWHPRPVGIQIKNSNKQSAAQAVLNDLADSLGKYYG
jgi:hypothetical protein